MRVYVATIDNGVLDYDAIQKCLFYRNQRCESPKPFEADGKAGSNEKNYLIKRAWLGDNILIDQKVYDTIQKVIEHYDETTLVFEVRHNYT